MLCKCLLIKLSPTIRTLPSYTTTVFFDLKIVCCSFIERSVLFIRSGFGVVRRLIILWSLRWLSGSLKPIIRCPRGVSLLSRRCSFLFLFISWITFGFICPTICLLSCISLLSSICLLPGNRWSLFAWYFRRGLIRIIEFRLKSSSIITWGLSRWSWRAYTTSRLIRWSRWARTTTIVLWVRLFLL